MELRYNLISNSKKAASSSALVFLWHEAMEGIGFDRLLFTLLTDHKTIGCKAGHIAGFKYLQIWLKQYSTNNYEEIDPVYRQPKARGGDRWSEKFLKKSKKNGVVEISIYSDPF